MKIVAVLVEKEVTEVKMVPKVLEFEMDAGDWGMYTVSDGPDDTMPADSAAAAEVLNAAIVGAVNAGKGLHEVHSMMCKYQDMYSKQGARDTEGRNALYDVLRKLFGPSNVDAYYG